MQQDIKEALKGIDEILEQRVLKDNSVIKTISINNVKPTELMEFIVKNKIPRDCKFSSSRPEIIYTEDLNLSSEDVENARRFLFNDVSFRLVKSHLLSLGYYINSNYANKHTKSHQRLFERKFHEFETKYEKSIYEYYKDGRFDILVDYYKIYFGKGKK